MAAMRYLSLGSPLPPPRDLLTFADAPEFPVTSLADVLTLASKARLHTTDTGVALLVHKPPASTVGSSGRTTRLPEDGTPRVYVPMNMRPWVLRTCHDDVSLHLGVHRTIRLAERFYWWIGLHASVRAWLRACYTCQARKTTRQTVRWPVLSLPLPSGPGVVVAVDYFGPLPVTPRGHAYILLFTDRFSRRADMFPVSAANFTAQGTADVLVNQYMTKWGCMTTLLSDNGAHFCSKLSAAIYELMGVRKVTTSSYHPQTNGGTERVNHTMAQILTVAVNERQTDWDVHLPHIEFAYNNSVSQATGLAPNEVHMGRIPRIPLSVFDHPRVTGHQGLDRDQVDYCNLAVDRQRRSYELVRECHALTVSRIQRRNADLSRAVQPPAFAKGKWAWVYNTAATIRQGTQKDTDGQVLKAKLSLPWTGPFQILAVGPAAAADTPDGRPLGSHLLYLDLPSDMPGSTSRARVSVYRCKPCHSAHDIDDLPAHLPAALSKYVLHSFGRKCPPFSIGAEDVEPSPEFLELEHISEHQIVRGQGGFLAVLFKAHWVGLATPSWERETDLQQFRRHILLYWDGKACQRIQGNRAYRVARSRAARRELARTRADRYFDYGYNLIPHNVWLRLFSSASLPINARFWYKSTDGLWWSGKNSTKQDASYIVRLFDDPAPKRLRLPHELYDTALGAPVGSWCLEKHRSSSLGADTGLGRVAPLAPPAPPEPATP